LSHGIRRCDAQHADRASALEVDGEARSTALLDRKKRLALLLIKVRDGIEYNDHLEGDGRDIYAPLANSATRA
jgi:hypothetical protein